MLIITSSLTQSNSGEMGSIIILNFLMLQNTDLIH